MMWGTGMGFGLGWLAMVFFGVFVVAGTIWLVSSLTRPAAGQGRAAQILAERFARGEIDAEEFGTRTRAIEKR